MPPTWNAGMLEQWARSEALLRYNGQKRITSVSGSRLLVRLWRIWINFHYFSINVDIDARDNHCFVAIVAFPNEWLSFLDVEKLLKV